MSDQPISDNPVVTDNSGPVTNLDAPVDEQSTTDDPAVVEQPAPEAPAAPATNDWASHPAGGLTGLYEYFSGELASLRAEFAKLTGSSGQA